MAQELSLFDFFEEEEIAAQAQETVIEPVVPVEVAEKEFVSVVEEPLIEEKPVENPEPSAEKPVRSDKKLYYSIGEVAQMFGLNASNLRFWEKEFSMLKPRTNKKGTRFYTHSDIENIKLICYLVKQQGLTLEGARKCLKNNLVETKRNAEIAERLLALKQEIKAIQEEINE